MNSNKTIILATAVTLAFVLAVSHTTLVPGINLFIGHGAGIDATRALILTLLLSLLVIKVPRPMALRLVVGITSMSLVVGSIYLLGNYQLALLDGLLFITLASVLGFEALEFDPQVMALGDALEA